MMFESKGSRLSQRVKGLVVVVLVVVALISVQPFLWKAVNELAEELNQKRFQIKQISEVKARSKEVKDEYEKQEVFLQQLTAVVPLGRETLQVIERLEGLANEIGADIEVESIREEEVLLVGEMVKSEEVPIKTSSRTSRRAPSKKEEELKKDEPSLLPLVVVVEVRAIPSVLLRYIEAVEHVQELAVVRSFILEPSNVDSEDNELEYVLSMEVIFYLQDYENKKIK